MDSVTQRSPKSFPTDRRVDRRYPIDAELESRLIHKRHGIETGHGNTVNLSRSGILFESRRPAGMHIELTIARPVLLGDAVALKFCVSGRTLRSQGKRTAVKILRHIFRTRRASEGDLRRPGGLSTIRLSRRTTLTGS